MKDRILIVATSTHDLQSGINTQVYVATSLEEAERFAALWDESELESAGDWGGYPGSAVIVGEEDGSEESATDWIAEQEALLAELAGD